MKNNNNTDDTLNSILERVKADGNYNENDFDEFTIYLQSILTEENDETNLIKCESKEVKK